MAVIIEEKPATEFAFGSGFFESFSRFLAYFSQRCEHDRRPATVVMVMPVRMMAAISAEHCSGLIPDSASGCQIYRNIVVNPVSSCESCKMRHPKHASRDLHDLAGLTLIFV